MSGKPVTSALPVVGHESAPLTVTYERRPEERRKRIKTIASIANIADVGAGIDVDALWRRAAAAFGGPELPSGDVHFDGVRCLARAIEQNARYDDAGLQIARSEVYGWMLSWLSFHQDLIEHPQISSVPIESPMFVAGFGRTGSTFLHNLLALDPVARTPRLWELWSPSPPRPEDRDRRIQRTRLRLRTVAQMAPHIFKIHPMEAEAPDECHWLMRHSPLWAMFHSVPDYWAWLKGLSSDKLHQLYTQYRLQIQHLQLFSERGRWLSKSFCHLHYLPVLFSVFPGARIVRLHRDPVRAVPSLCSLAAGYRSIYSDTPDLLELGRTILDVFMTGTRRAIDAEKSRGAELFVDILYEDLIADPVTCVRRIYDRFGYLYTAEFERAIVRRVVERRDVLAHKHLYEPEQFGLSRRRIRNQSAEYLTWLQERTGRRMGDA